MAFRSPDVLRNITDNAVAPDEDADDEDIDSGDADPNISLWNSEFERMKDLVHVISFRLAMSTPLLLVSKDIHSEVTRLLDNLQQYLAAQIYLQRIMEPTQAFLDIASRSRFAVAAGPIETLFLVKHLPDSIKPLVKEMAFMLQTWDDAGPLWGSWRGDGCVVTNTLCSELPNLRTIAMEVPDRLSGHELWTAAPLHHFHDLLKSKRIDTVRIFYGDGSIEEDDVEEIEAEDDDLEQVYRREFGPRNDVKDEEEIPEILRKSSSYIETKQREFDVVKVPSWTQWMSEPRFLEKEKLSRTIEITRWEDTKLGSATYKQLVEKFDGVFEPQPVPESGSWTESEFESESEFE
jgi:hypothetical protein